MLFSGHLVLSEIRCGACLPDDHPSHCRQFCIVFFAFTDCFGPAEPTYTVWIFGWQSAGHYFCGKNPALMVEKRS
jgi:hypothetical protein